MVDQKQKKFSDSNVVRDKSAQKISTEGKQEVLSKGFKKLTPSLGIFDDTGNRTTSSEQESTGNNTTTVVRSQYKTDQLAYILNPEKEPGEHTTKAQGSMKCGFITDKDAGIGGSSVENPTPNRNKIESLEDYLGPPNIEFRVNERGQKVIIRSVNPRDIVFFVESNQRWGCKLCEGRDWSDRNGATRHVTTDHIEGSQCPLFIEGRCLHSGYFKRADNFQSHWLSKHPGVPRNCATETLRELYRRDNLPARQKAWLCGGNDEGGNSVIPIARKPAEKKRSLADKIAKIIYEEEVGHIPSKATQKLPHFLHRGKLSKEKVEDMWANLAFNESSEVVGRAIAAVKQWSRENPPPKHLYLRNPISQTLSLNTFGPSSLPPTVTHGVPLSSLPINTSSSGITNGRASVIVSDSSYAYPRAENVVRGSTTNQSYSSPLSRVGTGVHQLYKSHELLFARGGKYECLNGTMVYRMPVSGNEQFFPNDMNETDSLPQSYNSTDISNLNDFTQHTMDDQDALMSDAADLRPPSRGSSEWYPRSLVNSRATNREYVQRSIHQHIGLNDQTLARISNQSENKNKTHTQTMSYEDCRTSENNTHNNTILNQTSTIADHPIIPVRPRTLVSTWNDDLHANGVFQQNLSNYLEYRQDVIQAALSTKKQMKAAEKLTASQISRWESTFKSPFNSQTDSVTCLQFFPQHIDTTFDGKVNHEK